MLKDCKVLCRQCINRNTSLQHQGQPLYRCNVTKTPPHSLCVKREHWRLFSPFQAERIFFFSHQSILWFSGTNWLSNNSILTLTPGVSTDPRIRTQSCLHVRHQLQKWFPSYPQFCLNDYKFEDTHFFFVSIIHYNDSQNWEKHLAYSY